MAQKKNDKSQTIVHEKLHRNLRLDNTLKTVRKGAVEGLSSSCSNSDTCRVTYVKDPVKVNDRIVTKTTRTYYFCDYIV